MIKEKKYSFKYAKHNKEYFRVVSKLVSDKIGNYPFEFSSDGHNVKVHTDDGIVYAEVGVECGFPARLYLTIV